MKKTFLILIVILLAGSAMAQTHEKNILGIRGGLNIASMTISDSGISETSDARAGFYIGVSDQILLSNRLPFYLETGINFSSRGGKGKGEGTTISFRPMYIQIPLLLNYHFKLRNNVTIQPFAGIYYGVGIAGKIKVENVKMNTFGDNGLFKRSDFGARLGVGVVWKRVYFGLNYDIGCMDMLKSEAGGIFEDTMDTSADFKMRNDCFSIGIGYNF